MANAITKVITVLKFINGLVKISPNSSRLKRSESRPTGVNKRKGET